MIFIFNLIWLIFALFGRRHMKFILVNYACKAASQKYYEIPVGNLFIYEYIAHKREKNIEHHGW